MPAPLRWAWLGTVPYAEAFALQRSLAARRAAEDIDDVLLLLEHPPVYTMGRNGEARHRRGPPERLRGLGADYVEVDRGGSITFHGPGQLVGYPVLRLASVFPLAGVPGQGDVIRYVRALELAMATTVARYGVEAGSRAPYTGLWHGPDKLAAIGVKLMAGGITTHGVALNITTDLDWFGKVVPCGIEEPGLGVASLASVGVVGATPELLAPLLAADIAAVLGREAMAEAPESLKSVGNSRLQPITAVS